MQQGIFDVFDDPRYIEDYMEWGPRLECYCEMRRKLLHTIKLMRCGGIHSRVLKYGQTMQQWRDEESVLERRMFKDLEDRWQRRVMDISDPLIPTGEKYTYTFEPKPEDQIFMNPVFWEECVRKVADPDSIDQPRYRWYCMLMSCGQIEKRHIEYYKKRRFYVKQIEENRRKCLAWVHRRLRSKRWENEKAKMKRLEDWWQGHSKRNKDEIKAWEQYQALNMRPIA